MVMVMTVIQLIPEGTVYNNLGPDHLSGPKAIEPNYCRPFITRPLSTLRVMPRTRAGEHCKKQFNFLSRPVNLTNEILGSREESKVACFFVSNIYG